MAANITVVIPSFNQASFLKQAIDSVLGQNEEIELVVMDGGSTDSSPEIIKAYETELHYWQSRPDGGQASAINEGMAKGTATYVCWLNSDDFFYTNALSKLKRHLEAHPDAPMVYGKTWNVNSRGNKANPYPTKAFSPRLFANYCLISQPATLIRRGAWEAVGGLDISLKLAFDYDLWWRLYLTQGKPTFLKEYVAANRMHGATKTHNNLDQHYDESIAVVRRHHGSVPVKWTVLRGIMRVVRGIAGCTRKYLR